MTVSAFAPAKINLTLHVTGKRPDGFHLLDSLVVFADVGDRIDVAHADHDDFRIAGPFAKDLPVDQPNLVKQAAKALHSDKHAAISLTKNLPVASGIGGGSADAAATLRALSKLWGVSLPMAGAVASLGADVPVCLRCENTRMSGIGEILQPVAGIPDLNTVLVNPMVPVATGAVFAGLAGGFGSPMPNNIPAFTDARDLSDWLALQRNDLQSPAINLAPVIGDVLSAISGFSDCLLARMSGSGATCFGIFQSAQGAQSAARKLADDCPNWWVRAASTGVAAS